jgi:deoxycytidylate deaminase
MNQTFIRLAIRQARSSTCHPYRFGAVIANKNVVSVGKNKQKTHPKSTSIWKRIHAEFDAVSAAKRSNLIGTTLFVARLTPENTLGWSRPCEDCIRILRSKGIAEIVYVNSAGNFETESLI